MLATVEKTIVENDLISPGDMVLVGISGGPDSVALFHSLLNLRDKLAFKLAACHLNHHIRSNESDADEQFTRELVKKHKVRFFSGDAYVMARKKKDGGSIEEIAREERYGFFRKIGKKCKADKIALGHTSDDNTETFLFNLVRGTGPKGLSGIPIKRPEGSFEVIRPLLDISKVMILDYLKREGLNYRVDSTNRDPAYTRNRIRLRLLPYLRRNYNPGIDSSIRNTSRFLHQCLEFIQDEINMLTDSIVSKLANGFSIDLSDYSELHPAMRELLIRELLVTNFKISANDQLLAHVRSLAKQEGRYRIVLPDDVTGFLEYGTLRFVQGISAGQHNVAQIPVPSKTRLPEWNMRIETSILKSEELPNNFSEKKRKPMGDIWCSIIDRGETVSLTEYLDADKVRSDFITIRSRESGDRYKPLGQSGRLTIKKLFIDQKIPISIREMVPVLLADGRIIYIFGFRMSESVKVRRDTINIMKLKMTIFPL